MGRKNKCVDISSDKRVILLTRNHGHAKEKENIKRETKYPLTTAQNNNEVFSLVRCVNKHNVFIIGRDMNTQIGKNVNNKFSLYNFSNRNGKLLTDFTLENRLTCVNNKFLKRKGKLYTYTNTNNTKAFIDYILMNKKWNNSAINCVAYSSVEGVSSDHRIVMEKIRLCL